MSRDQLAGITYEALTSMLRLKAKYGQLSRNEAEKQTLALAQGQAMLQRIDELVKSGNENKTGDTQAGDRPPQSLRYRSPFQGPDFRWRLSRPYNLLALWNGVANKKTQNHRGAPAEHGG